MIECVSVTAGLSNQVSQEILIPILHARNGCSDCLGNLLLAS